MSIFRFLSPGIKENWKVVMLSAVGAATFWFFNAMNKDYETSLNYPLDYDFVRDSVVIITPLPEYIKIDVASGGWNLIRRTLRINAAPILIPLENPSAIKFLTRSSLTPIVKEQLSGLDVTFVVTDTLYFNIEEKVIKKLPVIVDSLTIPLRNNYRITSPIKVYNDSVTLTGPKSIMSKIENNVEIAFADKEIDSDFEEDLKYRIDPLIKARPSRTTIEFDVRNFVLKEVDVPIEFLNFPRDSSVIATQKNIRVYYTIDEDHENEVDKNDFSITLDYSMLNSRDSTIAPILMYSPEKALDIVLNVDKVAIERQR
ncbi:YbbR-like domain-containing protein [Reichenbachiella versicolor]|uniref:hypothetical protein n=1 Tax=Reichenbachiella versicolor TaxID=1821036 RepID=UPI000D6E1437|nr:hypothetical protein [Reichenbachiella versicolor]